MSFLREKYNPKGGPDGGDGGNGGSAFIYGARSLNTLLHLKLNSTIYVAGGIHGKGKDRRGRDADDLFVPVPMGTVVHKRGEDGKKSLVVDVVDTSPHLVAWGGSGGWGNAHYVSSTNQEPVLAQKGERGQRVILFLELKLLADVGLVARPNAGKSTLLSTCSAAKPKIADYPFTTVEPVLGVVSSHGKDFVMVEVPGLLEGAHRGVGLGHQFLRHAERTRIHVLLIDGLSEDPVLDLAMVNEELREFSLGLAGKRQIIAVNKVDVTDVHERRKDIEACLTAATEESADQATGEPTVPVMFISAATGEGVQELLGKIVELLAVSAGDEQTMGPEPQDQPAQLRPAPREAVYKEGSAYVVESDYLERLAALADTRDQRVILQLWREMSRRGLARRLADAGIEPGDTIRIGQVEVEWF